ncbi:MULTISPECIES: hypothetical protein [Cyanophyceae]|uniref:hypothetical protein n=1 Tax=Cyanophyceae TaxID=3028117 RepID=UPI0016843486|nr:hypothetical protein [Trichocoleus sp. FACHB-40]MBD2002753.1 hypothetical protein [Trichocoleus sp. FACHB-40]
MYSTRLDRDRCLDFQPSVEPAELWAQKGTRFVDNDPVLEQPIYDSRPGSMPWQRFTPESKLELLDYYPMFTGRCPCCEIPFEMKKPPLVHWDCTRCGWVDYCVSARTDINIVAQTPPGRLTGLFTKVMHA